MTSQTDIHYMRHALSLARRGLGRTAENPAVGCVLVKKGRVIGRGWTADGGRPHAEIAALHMAGREAKGATAYVTLEPCAHHGKTPPCADALIEAGVERVVVGCGDPDERVSGRGLQAIENAGVIVGFGVLEEEARALNAGFLTRLTRNRPFVTLKIATSADNKIAAAQGERTQISGALAVKHTHLVRSQHDAILVGVGTALADDPLLTTRMPGCTHRALRVVLDSTLRTLLESKLVKSAKKQPLLIIHNVRGARDKIAALQQNGVELACMDPRNIEAVLAFLAQKGVNRVLVEGGAQVHAAFLESGMVDMFHWNKSKNMIGDQGVTAIANHDITALESAFGFEKQKIRALGEDLLEIYACRA